MFAVLGVASRILWLSSGETPTTHALAMFSPERLLTHAIPSFVAGFTSILSIGNFATATLMHPKYGSLGTTSPFYLVLAIPVAFFVYFAGRQIARSHPNYFQLTATLTVICALAVGLALAGGGDSASRHVLLGGTAIAAAAVVALLLVVLLLSGDSAEDLLLLLVARVPAGARIARRGGAMLADFTQALQVVRTRYFVLAVLWTLPIWVAEACAMWSVCRAVGADLDLTCMLSLLGGASLSTLVPTAPGDVGSYQMAFVVILGQFGIGATSAIVASTAVRIYLIGTLTLVGLAILAIASLVSTIGSTRRR